MYGNGYSMAIVLDHRSTSHKETKIGKCLITDNLGFWKTIMLYFE